MTATAATADADAVLECELPHPVSVNISPILKSVAGILTEAEIDEWMAGLYRANEGRGFVNALDLAARKALGAAHPRVLGVKLVDYKVRILDSESATAARVRVLIESTDGARYWTTVGCSTDIIEASWLALADALEYAIGTAPAPPRPS